MIISKKRLKNGRILKDRVSHFRTLCIYNKKKNKNKTLYSFQYTSKNEKLLQPKRGANKKKYNKTNVTVNRERETCKKNLVFS